ncbi:hypothetical protein JCM10449v2_003262 [Rhodotorula kratochvilovae]
MVYLQLVSALSPAGAGASFTAAEKGASKLGSSAVLFARSTIAAVSGLVLQSGMPALEYPTGLTRGVVPKNIHSHNDYTRPVPLLDALSVGAKSVEADIHLVDGELYVGHNAVSRSSSRTLDELYLDPLLEILRLQNPASPFSNETAALTNGIYEYDPSQTLQLMLDYKTNGTLLHPVVLSALSRFRNLDLLTTFDEDTSTLTVRPLTIVCTGNCALSHVLSQSPRRDVFLDAPLEDIANPEYTRGVALLASTSFKRMFGWMDAWDVGPEKSERIRALVEVARAKGIKTRFWETPSWPKFVRDEVWKGLLLAGVDWLNVDDLEAASRL